MTLSKQAKDFLWGMGITLAVVAILGAIFYPYPSKAEGTTANVSWTLPACYNDGTPAVPPATGCGSQSPLPPADISHAVVRWTGTVSGTKTVPMPATSTTVGVPCGSATFEVWIVAKSTAKYPGSAGPPTTQGPPVPYATGVQCAPLPPPAVTVN